MEAGTALQGYLALYFCCEEPTYWNQQAGLGDSIFAPIYEVLKRRGVHFKFFHKVEKLVLDNNAKLVKEIKMIKQVRVLTEEYSPVIDVKGLPSWPNEPKYDEILQEEAHLLQKHNIDLENVWSNWSRVYEESFGYPAPELVLKREKDFDIIVYGIPVGSLPFLCPELLENSSSLKEMNDHIGTVASLHIQLWSTMDLEYYERKHLRLQLERNEHHIVCDEEDILKTEDWKTLALEPKHLLYFLSKTKFPDGPIPHDYTSFPEEMKAYLIDDIQQTLKIISPNSFHNGVFNWTVLTDPVNRTGVERFDSQYVRLNVNPSDLFTQTLSNTSQYRITTDGAGFDNIYFTGDWIQNGINYGSIEGAITSGLLTSKAISGYPETVYSEQFIPKEKRKK